MTGFRVGYLLGPAPFIEAAARLKATISGATPLFSQYAALAALEGAQDSIEEFRNIYKGRLRVMSAGLDQLGIRYGKTRRRFSFCGPTSDHSGSMPSPSAGGCSPRRASSCFPAPLLARNGTVTCVSRYSNRKTRSPKRWSASLGS